MIDNQFFVCYVKFPSFVTYQARLEGSMLMFLINVYILGFMQVWVNSDRKCWDQNIFQWGQREGERRRGRGRIWAGRHLSQRSPSGRNVWGSLVLSSPHRTPPLPPSPSDPGRGGDSLWCHSRRSVTPLPNINRNVLVVYAVGLTCVASFKKLIRHKEICTLLHGSVYCAVCYVISSCPVVVFKQQLIFKVWVGA